MVQLTPSGGEGPDYRFLQVQSHRAIESGAVTNLEQPREDGQARRSVKIVSALTLGGCRDGLSGTVNSDIVWGRTASDGVWLPTKSGHHIHLAFDAPDVGAQTLSPGVQVFTGVGSDADIVVATAIDGMALTTVLHSAAAPSRFRYSLSLPHGLALDAMPSGGFDVVHELYGATVARMTRPRANDSTYRPLSVEYTHDNAPAILMEIDPVDAVFPIIAVTTYQYLP